MVDWINDMRDPDEIWKKMKEQQAANNVDAYYLLARRAGDLIDSYVSHYGLCTEVAAAYGAQARDPNACRPGRQVAAIRAHHYYQLASGIAANSTKSVRVVPEGWDAQGGGLLDPKSAELRVLQEAAGVLLQLDWVEDAWKWQWVIRCLTPVTQAMKTYDVAHLHLGRAYFKLDDLDRAESVWRQAQGLPNASQELHGQLVSLRLRRAQKAAEAKNWQEVIRILDGQWDLTPKELVLLGDGFQQLGYPDRARGTWEAALRGDPNETAAQERLGRQQQRQAA
ncbi:MAG: tetratricopeptide repeat protein [Chloroflexota bacterium]